MTMPIFEDSGTVVVTGFGPFGDHHVNSSWICAQELSAIGDIADNVNIVIEELPVEYQTVARRVPELWDEHRPWLMIHLGVSGVAEGLKLEQYAHNDGYKKHDVKGCIPDNGCCIPGSRDPLVSSAIDMDLVRKDVELSGCGINVTVSSDAGRYVCDFCYCTSLHYNRSRCAFIHVPPLDRPYSCSQLSFALRAAIRSMLSQIDT